MTPPSDARQILQAQLASGEIDEAEYDRIRARLDAEPVPIKRFYLRRLWRGEISLLVTYWLWGTLGSLGIGLVLGTALGVTESPGGTVVIVVLLLIWYVFLAVAIFRSGNRYYREHASGRRWWGRVAQVMACLGLLANFGKLSTLLPGNVSVNELDTAVAEANQAGPHMVSEHVRFDKLSRDGRSYVYANTILGPTHVPSTEDVATARTEAVRTWCDNHDLHRLLLSLDKASYRFVNEAGEALMSYDVAQGDCPGH